MDYMTAKKLGFEVDWVERWNRTFRRLSMSSIPSEAEVKSLVGLMDEHDEICFWNYFHVTISDPGSYVSVISTNGVFAFKEGNHGWSGSWKRISLDDLSKLIISNWDKDCDNGIYYYAVEVVDLPSNYLLRIKSELGI